MPEPLVTVDCAFCDGEGCENCNGEGVVPVVSYLLDEPPLEHPDPSLRREERADLYVDTGGRVDGVDRGVA